VHCANHYTTGELRETPDNNRHVYSLSSSSLASNVAEHGRIVAEHGRNVAEHGRNVAEHGRNVAEHGRVHDVR